MSHTTIARLLRGESVPDRASVSAISAATNGEVGEAEVLASFGSARGAAAAA